jgi:ElaB/YqjD/DUF883 family membrane-anchored ribosome-binding protein
MMQSMSEQASEQGAGSTRRTSQAACAVADAFEDGIGAVRRVAKQGGDAAEEFIDDTTKRLQRHPIETVVTTFAIGVGLGTLIGWMIKRR